MNAIGNELKSKQYKVIYLSSEKFTNEYIAAIRNGKIDEFQNYFSRHSIQMPLEKGDLLFFNPAVFHAAGQNTSTDIYRMANLLQISS